MRKYNSYICLLMVTSAIAVSAAGTSGAAQNSPPPLDSAKANSAVIQNPSNAIDASSKLLRLIYCENKVPVPGKALLVRYYNEKTKKSVLLPATTDDAGSTVINIPANGDGSSYVFQVAVTESQFPKANAFRFAPRLGNNQGGQPEMVVTIDEKLYGMFTKAATQLMQYPAEGKRVGNGGDIATGTLGWALLRK
jgi:hypothetical protein